MRVSNWPSLHYCFQWSVPQGREQYFCTAPAWGPKHSSFSENVHWMNEGVLFPVRNPQRGSLSRSPATAAMVNSLAQPLYCALGGGCITRNTIFQPSFRLHSECDLVSLIRGTGLRLKYMAKETQHEASVWRVEQSRTGLGPAVAAAFWFCTSWFWQRQQPCGVIWGSHSWKLNFDSVSSTFPGILWTIKAFS